MSIERVVNVGSDVGSITPMLADIERRTGQSPETLLADGGHAEAGRLIAFEPPHSVASRCW